MDETKITVLVKNAIERALLYATSHQHTEGYWSGEQILNPITETTTFFALTFLNLQHLIPINKLVNRLLRLQSDDGYWNLTYGWPGDLSTTVECYAVIKWSGLLDEHDQRLVKAKEFIIKSGGIHQCRIWTKFFLAMFGILSWNEIPALFPELILVPPKLSISVYHISTWARAVMVPLSLIWYHKPVYRDKQFTLN